MIVLILTILLAGLLLYINRQRLHQRRQLCEFRQIVIAQAILQYEAQQGEFPGYRNLQARDRDGRRQAASWVFPVLPHIRDDERAGPWSDLYQRYGPQGDDATRGQRPSHYLPDLVCPDNPPPDRQEQPNWMSWVVNSGMPDAEPTEQFPPDWPANGVFLDLFTTQPAVLPRVSLDYIEQNDGATNTLLLSENVDAGTWTDVEQALVGFVWVANLVDGVPDPGDQLYRINRRRGEGDGSMKFARPASFHSGGVNVVFCDGRTQFLSEAIDYLAYTHLMTADGENVRLAGQDQLLDPPFRRVVAVNPGRPE